MRPASLAALVPAVVLAGVACQKQGDTSGPGDEPGGPPEWVIRPPPLPSETPFVSEILTPGCPDGAWLFDIWLSGWGGEVVVTASLGGATEVVSLVSQELRADAERWSGPGAGAPFGLSCDGAEGADVLYEIYSLDFQRTDCVGFGPSDDPACADASAW